MPGGYTFQQIIDTADKRTERRGGTLDLKSEAITALTEVCLYQRWWWRRKIMSMVLTAGESQFDLSDAANFTGEFAADDFQQMVKNGFKVYASTVSGGSDPQVTAPAPVFDADEQERILALQSTWGTGSPCRYFVMGAPGTLVTDLILDQDRPASLAYWAVPNLRPDEDLTEVPLLPPYLHSILIKRLEMHIYAFGLGEGSTKYMAAEKEYEYLCAKASNYRSFADGEMRSMASQVFGDAVQSS